MRPKILIFKNIGYFATPACYKHAENSYKYGSRGNEPVYSFRKVSK